jgi:hypothetical protein
MALESLIGLPPLHMGDSFGLLKTVSGTRLDEWSAHCKELYLHRTAQHTKTRPNIHALSEIWIHDLSIQLIKAYTLDYAATGTNKFRI